MTDIVQMSKGGKKFYPQTHVQAVLGLQDSLVGTNLITNLSSNWTQGWLSSSIIGTPPTFASVDKRIRTLQPIPVSSNSTYTISINNALFKLSWLEVDSNGNVTYPAPWITSANYTFTTTSTTTQLYIVVSYKNEAALNTSNLPKIKLEKGSVATDYSLNPEDILTKGDTVINVISQADYDALADKSGVYFIKG